MNKRFCLPCDQPPLAVVAADVGVFGAEALPQIA